ncbi:tripartite tricarboxylate transporter TctB family protein [Starkeya sp. ORNL1]|uniref:tripartite tricarboxylate transporter TctB family protein n=1 Tax=Starkeya sp. ORNL1 TaxID=2709380 RepID=UPI0014631504|nr:tripartite tricarboxylate transporter TctB family protein [Starkeya sp. ORNL1]QJP16969.1 tripartite tricarboxylate transporter TctB family protein [Starkeya sp. ORNL1]
MKRMEYIPPLFFTVVGVVIMYQSLVNLVYFDSNRGAPGPGFLAFWLSVGLLGISAGIIAGIARRPALADMPRVDPEDVLLAEMEHEAEIEESWPERAGWIRIAYLMIPFVLLLAVFEHVGFIISTALYMMVAGYGLGYRRLPILIPVSVLSATVLYVLFDTWLGVNLPSGLISF